jgi:hypothetical protein
MSAAAERLTLEKLIELGKEGQKQILAETLAAGHCIAYADEHGNWVHEHPDGRIEIVRPAEARLAQK